MARLYLIKVKNGSMTLDDVPEKWRDEVAILLDEEAAV